jgi:hydrogenase expression/formation protein HypE
MAAMILSCPVPLATTERIQLAHGAGGRLSRDLIENVFLPAFANDRLTARHDGAVFRVPYTGGLSPRVAFTTDSYVVRPLFFPGGDIGSLAVNGSVNDLAMCGARPLALSVALVIEEGFPMADLQRIVRSIAVAARDAGVEIATGDTKVVDKGKGDGVFVNTSGVGVLEHAQRIEPSCVRMGDCILLSGDLGRHGVAILSARESLGFATDLTTDCASLVAPVLDLLDSGIEVHCLRDLTRGGLAAALVEIALTSNRGLDIREEAIPISEPVAGACETLGLDPLYVANEGRFIAFVPPQDAERAADVLRHHPVSADVRVIGQVAACGDALVRLKTRLGVWRIVDLPTGELLPRIC